jgi:hypothetical protein
VIDALINSKTATRTCASPTEFERIGHETLAPLFEPSLCRLLAHEATALENVTRPWGEDRNTLTAEGQLCGARRHATARPGPLLDALHRSASIVELLGGLSGKCLRPARTRASYVYFLADSFVGLHTDLPECYITAIISVLGSPEPLTIHPELRGLSGDKLLKLADATDGQPPGGERLPLPRNGLLALRGSAIPHRVRRVRLHGVLAILCYTTCEDVRERAFRGYASDEDHDQTRSCPK